MKSAVWRSSEMQNLWKGKKSFKTADRIFESLRPNEISSSWDSICLVFMINLKDKLDNKGLRPPIAILDPCGSINLEN